MCGWACNSVSNVVAECARSPGFHPQHHIKVGILAHSCNLSTGDVEARGSGVQGHPQLRFSLKPASEGEGGDRAFSMELILSTGVECVIDTD